MARALLLPGSAASPDFLRRAFAPVIGDRSITVVADDSGDAGRIADRLAREVAHDPAPDALVIGVSVGAHAAARWAASASAATPAAATADAPGARLVLAMPAWTGPPGDVAAATAYAAARLESVGVPAELDRLHREFGEDWVVDELDRAWRGRDAAQLCRALRGTAASAGPTVEQLRAIRLPTVVLALRDDPAHPLAVAEQWAGLVPHSRWTTVGRDEPQTDRTLFGQRAGAALARLAATD